MIKGKKESAEDKIDHLCVSYYTTGLDHINNATKTRDDNQCKHSINEAASNFMQAANIVTGFVKAMSMLHVAACNHLIRE